MVHLLRLPTHPAKRRPNARGLRVALSALVVALVLPLLAAILPAHVAEAQADMRRVEILPLRDGFLDPPVAAQIADVLALAQREGAELVVIQFDAAGGVSVDAAALAARIAASSVPVAVTIGPIGSGPRAAGAAAAVFLAAHVRAVAPDATVGPLAPLDLRDLDAPTPDALGLVTGTPRTAGTADAEPDAAMRATLGRLTDTAVDAQGLVTAGLARITTGVEPLLVELDGQRIMTAAGEVELRLRPDETQVRFHSLGLFRRMVHAAATAPFVYLLLVVGLGMLLFEVFQPGFGVAGLAGVITVVIGFVGAFILPVRWWAVALVVLGLLLYALDTALAGFGPVTALATVTFAAGSWWFYAAPALQLSAWLVASATLSALVFFVLVLTTVLRAQAGPEGTDVAELIGRNGVVRSMLNPEGHVYIDGALWRARIDGPLGATGGVRVGTAVRVDGVDGAVILVAPLREPGREPDRGAAALEPEGLVTPSEGL
jgi:membrane-bound serine protease (ClpP class)